VVEGGEGKASSYYNLGIEWAVQKVAQVERRRTKPLGGAIYEGKKGTADHLFNSYGGVRTIGNNSEEKELNEQS